MTRRVAPGHGSFALRLRSDDGQVATLGLQTKVGLGMGMFQEKGWQQRKTGPLPGQKLAVLMLLLAAFFWGSGNVANKTVLQDLDPIAAVALRSVIAFVVLLPFAFRELLGVLCLEAWTKAAVLPSVLFATAIVVQQWGYQHASVTNASFLVNTGSCLTPFIAFVVLRERMPRCISAAVALTLLGAFLMSGAGRSLGSMNLGDVACLVSAVFYAGWIVALSRHALKHGCPLALTCMQCGLTFVLATLLLMLLDPRQPGSVTSALPKVIYLGIFSTAIAFGLAAAAQKKVSASTAGVLMAAESLFGAAGGIWLLGERPGLLAILGACAMLFAIYIVARDPALPAGEVIFNPISEKG